MWLDTGRKSDPDLNCHKPDTDKMSSTQKQRNYSSDSMGRSRVPSDDGFYQGMLKAMDGRKGTRVKTTFLLDHIRKKNFRLEEEGCLI